MLFRSMLELAGMKPEDSLYLEFTNDGKFKMMLMDEAMEGTFKVSGNAVTLTVDGEAITATIDGNKITMAQDGISMVFEKK